MFHKRIIKKFVFAYQTQEHVDSENLGNRGFNRLASTPGENTGPLQDSARSQIGDELLPIGIYS